LCFAGNVEQGYGCVFSQHHAKTWCYHIKMIAILTFIYGDEAHLMEMAEDKRDQSVEMVARPAPRILVDVGQGSLTPGRGR